MRCFTRAVAWVATIAACHRSTAALPTTDPSVHPPSKTSNPPHPASRVNVNPPPSAATEQNFTVRNNSNNCYGDGPACVFRGRYPDGPAGCEAVCANDPHCTSFTWVGATGDSFQYECRTRSDAVWALTPETLHVAGYKGVPKVCSTVADCNNGGDCVGGECHCDPTWRGDTCDVLNLLPAQAVGNGDTGYVLGSNGSVNTWGGSILLDPSTQTAHMYAAAFPNGTLGDWETDSIVIHLTSTLTSPQGPYEYRGTVATPRREASPPLWDSLDCHNPTVHKLGDEYVVFYIGVGVNASLAAPAHGEAPRFDKAQTIGAAFSTSPNGPWNRTEHPILVATEGWECGGGPDCGVSNPAILVRPDGQLNLFYRGNQDRGVGVATASSWRGPWHKSAESTTSNGIFKGNIVVGLEDMYVWANPPSTNRPGCHMILHQEEAGTENLGAHAFTLDPTCVEGWQLSNPRPSHAYGPEVAWVNGSTTVFGSRERPQVVLSSQGWPLYLSNGVITTDWAGRSFTIVAPIGAPKEALGQD